MHSKACTILAGAAVVTAMGLQEQGTVVLQRNKITEVQKDLPASLLLNSDDVDLIPLGNEFVLTPGLIDLQLNGAYGCTFGEASIPALQTVLNRLPAHGITGLLPTLITAPLMDMVASCNTLEEVIHITQPTGTRLLGIHLEGPFLNPLKSGAHAGKAMLEATPEALSTLLSPNVKLMTLAPELNNTLPLLDALQTAGVKAFAGHTQANRSQLEAAITKGLVGVTHLMNAMNGLHHREPGTALFVLNEDRLMASIIADGVHIHPDMLRLIIRCKTVERLVLVSDAMSLAGQPEGTQTLFGEYPVTHEGNRAVNSKGVLAGSVQLLPTVIRNLVQWGLCSFADAITMATRNPARLLGLEGTYGSIAPGAMADLVLWDRRNLDVVATWVGGQLVWCNPKRLPQPMAPVASQAAMAMPNLASFV